MKAASAIAMGLALLLAAPPAWACECCETPPTWATAFREAHEAQTSAAPREQLNFRVAELSTPATVSPPPSSVLGAPSAKPMAPAWAAPPSRPFFVHATASEPVEEPEGPGEQATVEADRMEARGTQEDGTLVAEGNVRASFLGILLQAGRVELDRRTMRGEASGGVRLSRGIYMLRADRITFDLQARTVDADAWQALIEKQGWFGGRKLHLKEDLVYSEDVRVSPCLKEDPGYWFAGERLEWRPKDMNWNLRGNWVSLVVGGVPVVVLPFFAATIGEEAQRRKLNLNLPDSSLDASVGYDGSQGIFVDTHARARLWDVPITVPIRVMSSRGVAAGLQQTYQIADMPGRFDGNYTQYFPWIPVDPGRQGPHGNFSLNKDWGNGAHSVLNLGYRVDVGFRNDLEYQVDPGGYPVHRLPELVTSWPHQQWGALGLDPGVRTGYLVEDIPNGGAAGMLQGNVGLSLPGWHPNSFWGSGFYGGANATLYGGWRTQSLAFLGLGNTQTWTPWLTSSFNLETQPVVTSLGGSPFLHDRASAVDRVIANANWNLAGPWWLGAGAFWAHSHGTPYDVANFPLGDLYFNFRYSVNCLSLGITFRPPRGGQPFQYTFDTQIVTF